MQKIYFDSSVTRRMLEDPRCWNIIYDQLIPVTGLRFQTVQSLYLFLEYIGFHKDRITIATTHIKIEIVNAGSSKDKEVLARKIDDILEINLPAIHNQVKQQLLTMKSHFNELIAERFARTKQWSGSNQLITALFGDFLDAVNEYYDLFVEAITQALVWDLFCCMESKDFPTNLLRERQIGYWHQLHNTGPCWPLGKLVDDLHKYLKMNFSSFLKNKEDMVDSEMLTLAILGQFTDDRRIPILCLTFDSSDTISERLKLALVSLKIIEKTLVCNINARTGKIYCLNPSNCQILNIHEPLKTIYL